MEEFRELLTSCQEQLPPASGALNKVVPVSSCQKNKANADETSALPGGKSRTRRPRSQEKTTGNDGKAKKDDPGGKPYSGGKVPKITLQDIKMHVDLKGLNASDAISAIIAETGLKKSALAKLLDVNPQSIYDLGQGKGSLVVERMLAERLNWNNPDNLLSPLTLEDIKNEVPIDECDTIHELIEAVLELCNITQSKLAGLLDIDANAISQAKKGNVFPYVERAFRQHLGWKGGPGDA